jgi:SAM-dependent methyltransferase
MEQAVCKRVATVSFWNGYAGWHKLWMGHAHYHDKIIQVLMSMTGRGWRVLDIGAGNGVLSIPLCARGCDVAALEPSIGMQNLLCEEMFKNRIDGLSVDERIWEEVPYQELVDYDLVLACNTLHLTQMGFEEALAKVFRARPENVLLISEVGPPEVRVKWRYGNYTMAFTKSYEIDGSYAYHHLREMEAHWSFKKGRSLQPDEIRNLKEKIVVEDGHLWMKDRARVTMYWWKRNR